MSELIGHVTVHDEDGVSHTFEPGAVVPDWAVEKITNPAVWAVEEPAQPEPKRRGRPAKTD